MTVLQWDDYILAKVNISEYLTSQNYSQVPFKARQNPAMSWAIPFVTGHTYKISWGYVGIDWDQMQVDLSERWRQNDLNIMLVHNFSLVRQAINVTVNGVQIPNNSLPSLNVQSPLLQTGQNLVLNDSTLNQNLPASIQTHFICAFNGQNMSGKEKQVLWKGIQCIGACNEVVKVVPLGNITYWSNASSWTNRNKTVPKDGDSVVIESGWNMILDVNTPNLTKLTINGRLTFLNATNITMTAQIIFVYAGELIIGSKDYPFLHNAQILLQGGRFSTPFAFEGSVEGGNKLLANVGTIKMFGKQRKYLFRLHQPAIYGSNQFYIETGLDLVKGDQLGVLPTSYDYSASDQVFVQSYNNETGLVTINSTLTHYHWGAIQSTASKYNGVDIRGEVVLLNRNIQIIGQDLDGWGGQVVTSSTLDSNMNAYNGQTIMDNVEIINCSQNETQRAALRFGSNSGTFSSITNSSIHNGAAWGIFITNSQNIFISDLVIFDHSQIGINIDQSSNITVRNSFISNIQEKRSYTFLTSNPIVNPRAGITVCGYNYPKAKCINVFIYNNIVSGAPYAGYVINAQNCGDTSQDKFFNNIAHSIKGAFGGNGVELFADTTTNQAQTCYQASSFIAYKCWQQGAFSYDSGTKVIYQNMTMIDNVQGLGFSMANPSITAATFQIFNDNYIYGESEIPDCPDEKTNDYCFKVNKQGIYPGQITSKRQEVMQCEIPHLPVYMNHFDTVNSNARVIWNRNKFFNFKEKTALGAKQSIIGFSVYSMDYTPMYEFYDTQFTNIDDAAMAILMSPMQSWANVEDCGNFPCTGPNNLLYYFVNSVWLGSTISNPQSNFQVIPNNPGISPYVSNCQYKKAWNGYYCYQDTLSLLLFQSLDQDRLNRAYQPINITQQGTRIKNVLNAFMDHNWDGFYTSLKRVPMFPALIDAPLGSVYNISYTSSPPQNQQFTLYSMVQNTGMTVRIAYPDAVSYAIYLNNRLMEMNQWDKNANQYGPIKQKYCGENRYIGVKNILEFFITGNCTLAIKPRDAIQSMVRMEWTMSQFYASGGTTTFADRLCSALGIHASRMKVVSVYEGSLVINYNILQAQDSSQSLGQINQLQTQLFATGSIDLGAPILDASSTLSTGNTTGKTQSIIKNGVVTAGGYTPVTINSQSTNQANQPKGVYIPDVQIVQQQQTIYRNVTVEVIKQQNSSQSQFPILIESQTNTSSNSWIAIPVVLGIFFVIVVIVGAKWYINMKKVKESDLQAIKAAQLRQQELAQYNSVKKLNQAEETFDESPDKSIKKSQMFHEVARSSVVEEYGQQYDPNNDFAIFGIGDKTKGGIQSLKEKMNLADIVENEELSSEDEQQVQPSNKTQSQSGSNQVSASPLNSDGNSIFKPTSSQTQRLPNPQSDQNNMPENQEIYDL